MKFYQTTGTLTGVIAEDNVELAQNYLTDDDMTKYFQTEPYGDAIEEVRWDLNDDGHNYTVHVKTNRKLTKDERKALGSDISGQNSDGLGEGFEQQDWAWADCEGCDHCDAYPFDTCDNGHMILFDWQKNPSTVMKVA